MRLLWWTNVYTFMCFCLLLLVSVRLAFSSCVTTLFLLGLFWGLPRSHRLSSHSRLNAFVIQTKLNLIQNWKSQAITFGFLWKYLYNDIHLLNAQGPRAFLRPQTHTRVAEWTIKAHESSRAWIGAVCEQWWLFLSTRAVFPKELSGPPTKSFYLLS